MAGRSSADEGSLGPVPPLMNPARVAPMLAFLAHESCPVSGEVYGAGANHFTRIFIAETPGYLLTDGEPTVDDVGRNWAKINDETGYYVPADLMDWASHFVANR